MLKPKNVNSILILTGMHRHEEGNLLYFIFCNHRMWHSYVQVKIVKNDKPKYYYFISP
jgi:hypothetical protein